MDEYELEQRMKKKDIVSRFPNGEERMAKSPLFNVVVQTLMRTDNYYPLIDQLINMVEDTQKALADRIINNPPERIVIKDGREYKLSNTTEG